ncbi:hypothetical protein [Frigoriglobus tundricola]|uniref:DUF3352 domain-containing protein n=1 Tax=Frigoriglobus tundricola TaxID=2774151 RepID=A0A6M5Z2Z2_9BACT|nr:hypothetical protein [Frigoriglobus tundricola]QJW99883.1 hypothetical protein FTUN_7506 [Frigoriglobus tundricola]
MFASARHRIPLGLVLAVVLLPFAVTGQVRAADPAPATALDKLPVTVETYQSVLRLGETIELLGRSRAWQQLWNDPAVKEVRKKAAEEFAKDGNEGAAALRAFLAEPANAELPALALDAVSNEVFVSTGAGTGDLLSLSQELLGGARYGPAFQKLLGGDVDDPNLARIRIVLKSLSEKPERLRIPDLLIGFKVSDAAKVKAQLKRLDPIVTAALADTPLKGRSKRAKVDEDEFLVLELDGSLVPWEMVPIAMFEEKEGEFAPLLKHLKSLKLTVAIGVRQGYLLVAIGPSTEQLAKFGGPGPKLAGRPEFKPLTESAGKPLTAVGYTSAALRQAAGATAEDVLGFGEVIKAGLEQADLPDDLRKAIEKDAEALLKAVAKDIAKAGAATSFSFRTARGWETYAHDYTPPAAGEPRPLTLLNHLGGDPLMAAVWRSGTTVDDYRAAVKWTKIIAGHVEQVALVKAPDAEPIIKTVRQEIYPVLKELSDVTERLWLPALADGQEGVVLDAKWTSKQWHAAMPPADRPLPLLELGVVVGVSDRAKLEKALEGYRVGVNKLLNKAREVAPPGTIPEFEIPRPKVETKGGRTFAHYPLPAGLGVDEQFQPTGGLSDKVAVLTLSRGHADRLLTETPFTAGLTPFTARKAADSAFYLNWAGLIDATGPWVDFGARMAAAEGDAKKNEVTAMKVLGVLKIFRKYGSVTYRQNGATVTHSEAVFQDVTAVEK